MNISKNLLFILALVPYLGFANTNNCKSTVPDGETYFAQINSPVTLKLCRNNISTTSMTVVFPVATTTGNYCFHYRSAPSNWLSIMMAYGITLQSEKSVVLDSLGSIDMRFEGNNYGFTVIGNLISIDPNESRTTDFSDCRV